MTTALFKISTFPLDNIWPRFLVTVVVFVTGAVLVKGLDSTTLVYFNPEGVPPKVFGGVAAAITLAGTCLILFLLITTTLFDLIGCCNVINRLADSVLIVGGLEPVDAMVTIFVEVLGKSYTFCGEPS